MHTRDGLVPIEAVEVGDWVLAQPESKGEIAYKRVVNKVSFENAEVYSVDFATRDKIGTLIATANHLFWLKNGGWTRADRVPVGAEIELHDNIWCTVFNVSPIFRTTTPNVGWVQGGFGVEDPEEPLGRLVDLRGPSPVLDYDHTHCVANEAVELTRENLLRTPVFGLEVEEFRTYYVGDLGVWVHNANRPEAGSASHLPARWKIS